MKNAALAGLALVAVLAAGCGGEKPPVDAPAPAPSPAPAPGPGGAAPMSLAYPLDTCVVSGDKLGEMGEPVVYMHEGTEVRFCCKNCIPEFKKDPAKYLAKIEEARKK